MTQAPSTIQTASASVPTRTVEPKLARALIRSLTRGTALPRGAGLIHVGHHEWLAAQAEILNEIAEDGYSDTKFVRGAYGAGKSHFLSVVQEMARREGWVTSHIECHFDHVEIDRFETLYPALVKKLSAADFATVWGESEADAIAPIHSLLKKWTERQLAAVGLRGDSRTRPFDADSRLFAHLAKKLLRGALPTNFARALTTHALASFASDIETSNAVCSWLSGAKETVSLPAQYLRRETRSIGKPDNRGAKALELRPINAGTVQDAMHGLLWLIKDAGYAGLILCIDEVEELARLATRKRQDRALQALREYVDHAGGDEGHKWLCMYLAATPEMFDSEQYFPRYDALASRIQAVSDNVNWRAPVIDLDRTPLSGVELHSMAAKIRELYDAAYGSAAVHLVTDKFLGDLVAEIVRTKVRMARSAGSKYAVPNNFDALITRAVTAIEKATEQ